MRVYTEVNFKCPSRQGQMSIKCISLHVYPSSMAWAWLHGLTPFTELFGRIFFLTLHLSMLWHSLLLTTLHSSLMPRRLPLILLFLGTFWDYKIFWTIFCSSRLYPFLLKKTFLKALSSNTINKSDSPPNNFSCSNVLTSTMWHKAKVSWSAGKYYNPNKDAWPGFCKRSNKRCLSVREKPPYFSLLHHSGGSGARLWSVSLWR